MKLKNSLLGSIVASSILFAGGDIVPVETIVENVPVTNTWSYELEPYLFASSMTGDSNMGRVTGIPIDVNFGDIMEVFDIGAMVHFEAHHQSGWGIWLDYGFVNLSDDLSGERGGIVNASLHQGVLEAFGLYRQEFSSGHMDYYGGIRWWDNDIDVGINPAVLPGANASIEEDWVDLVIGARWTQPLNENWQVSLRGDVGGFGISSDFTATTAVGFKYIINNLMDLDMQYKMAWVDYESGTVGTADHFKYDVVMFGPTVGLNFKF